MYKKATTSILPYLREKEKQAQGAAEAGAPADTPKSPVKPPEAEKLAQEMDQYDKERLAILRGAE